MYVLYHSVHWTDLYMIDDWQMVKTKLSPELHLHACNLFKHKAASSFNACSSKHKQAYSGSTCANAGGPTYNRQDKVHMLNDD